MRALLIWNPVSGRKAKVRAVVVERLASSLRAGGWEISLAESEREGGAGPAARRGVEQKFTALIACGGDGTLHEVVNAVAGRGGTDMPVIGVAPLGTANVFAFAAGCPAGAEKTAAWLLRAEPNAVMLGRAVRATRSDYFVCMASAGLDAAVVHSVDARAKSRWGKMAYAAGALRALYVYRGGRFELHAPERHLATGLIFGLTRFYGGRMRLGRMRAGEAIVLALRGGALLTPVHSAALAAFSLEQAPGVARLRTRAVVVDTPGIPLQLDGEAAGFTPVRLEVSSEEIQMLLAPGYNAA